MSTLKLQKLSLRWLFGGLGFHNSEATMTPIMNEQFKVQRVPSTISNIQLKDNLLSWSASTDTEHCYYRVFKEQRQIASTVATSLPVTAEGAYTVVSVDKYGNVGN